MIGMLKVKAYLSQWRLKKEIMNLLQDKLPSISINMVWCFPGNDTHFRIPASQFHSVNANLVF